MIKRNDTVKQAKIFNIIASLVVFAAGVVMLIIPTIPILCIKILLGGMCIVFSTAKLLGYYSNDLYRLAFQFDFAIGIFSAVLAILIFVSPDKAMENLPLVFGFYVIFDALLKLQTALDSRKFGIKKWIIILISAVFLVLFGIFCIMSLYIEGISRKVGLSLALMSDGIENMWIVMYTVRVRVKKKNMSEIFKV